MRSGTAPHLFGDRGISMSCIISFWKITLPGFAACSRQAETLPCLSYVIERVARLASMSSEKVREPLRRFCPRSRQ